MPHQLSYLYYMRLKHFFNTIQAVYSAISADAYITKPFHPRHILATVEQLLHKRTVLKEYFNSARSDVTVREGITLHHEDERMLHEIVVFIENNIDDESLNPTAISDFIGIGKTSLMKN